eukprot:scaffold64044_cov71-Phaeocystis_antarctica.AAC.1
MDRFHAAYRTLLLLRFLLALAPGYLHPDEYFQSFEPAARLVLSVHTEPAWEWAPATTSSRPIRSWLVPVLSCALPMRLVAALARAVDVHTLAAAGRLPGRRVPCQRLAGAPCAAHLRELLAHARPLLAPFLQHARVARPRPRPTRRHTRPARRAHRPRRAAGRAAGCWLHVPLHLRPLLAASPRTASAREHTGDNGGGGGAGGGGACAAAAAGRAAHGGGAAAARLLAARRRVPRRAVAVHRAPQRAALQHRPHQPAAARPPPSRLPPPAAPAAAARPRGAPPRHGG